MFFSNNTKLESTLDEQIKENEELKVQIEELTKEKLELQKQARYSDGNQVMNDLIKSLTQGLTNGCDRDLKIIQDDLVSNLDDLEDIDTRNQINNEHTES